MEQMNDGILALLKDSKQMIFVCGLLLLGIFLTRFQRVNRKFALYSCWKRR